MSRTRHHRDSLSPRRYYLGEYGDHLLERRWWRRAMPGFGPMRGMRGQRVAGWKRCVLRMFRHMGERPKIGRGNSINRMICEAYVEGHRSHHVNAAEHARPPTPVTIARIR